MTTCFEAAIEIASGHPAIDRYLAESYEQVRGMSSRFAAAICGHLIRRQSELAIAGDLVEIGTFEGRFFIAMALGLESVKKPSALIGSIGPTAASKVDFSPIARPTESRVTASFAGRRTAAKSRRATCETSLAREPCGSFISTATTRADA